jgi:tight adherence protein C
MLLLLLALMCLGGAVYLIGDVITMPGRERELSVKRAARYGKLGIRVRPQAPHFRQRVVSPLRNQLAGLVLRVNPRTNIESVQIKILSAGLGRRVTATGFLALKGVGVIAGILLALLFGAAGRGSTGLFFILAFAGCGFFAPDGLLTMLIRKRKDEIGAALPDALDLLAVSVEAGLGFDGAIAKLAEFMEGPLVDEFNLMLSEMRIGESRQDALKRLGTRVPTPEVGAFVRSIVQSDQLGTSLGRILRVQATDTRLRRQAAAEEKAMKAPIKMLFPTVLFIFPSMFLVILGPALMNISALFG